MIEKIDSLVRSAREMEDRLGAQIEIIAAELMREADDRNQDRIETALNQIAVIQRKIQRLIVDHHARSMTNTRNPQHQRVAADIRANSVALKTFNAVRYRFKRWSTVLADIRYLADWRGSPLFENPTPETAYLWAQARALESAFQALHEFINPHKQSDEARELGCFEDISMPALKFGSLAHAALRVGLAQCRDTPMTFLDVGCGAGMKVLQAAQLFQTAHGLEYDPGYVEAAEAMLRVSGEGRCAVFHADALTFDRYDDYDVIYFYRPMRNEALLEQLEKRIVSAARPGTILVNHYVKFGMRAAEFGASLVAPGIYITGSNADQAAELGAAAEKIICTQMALPPEDEPGAGYQQPITLVARHRGYGKN